MNKITSLENFIGEKHVECYMKKKRLKNKKILNQKTSYKYFIADLVLEKLTIKSNKESKAFLTIYIAGKKYTLFQKDERDYHRWIRLFEFYFNSIDIGSYAEFTLRNKPVNEFREKLIRQSITSLVMEKEFYEGNGKKIIFFYL